MGVSHDIIVKPVNDNTGNEQLHFLFPPRFGGEQVIILNIKLILTEVLKVTESRYSIHLNYTLRLNSFTFLCEIEFTNSFKIASVSLLQ